MFFSRNKLALPCFTNNEMQQLRIFRGGAESMDMDLISFSSGTGTKQSRFITMSTTVGRRPGQVHPEQDGDQVRRLSLAVRVVQPALPGGQGVQLHAEGVPRRQDYPGAL